MTSSVFGRLESTVSIGGLSTLHVGLCSIGIPKCSVLKYQSIIKAGKFLFAHGTPDEVTRAREVLDASKAIDVAVHNN